VKVLLFNEIPAPTHGAMNHYVMGLLPMLDRAEIKTALVHGRAVPSTHRGTGYLFNALAAGTRYDAVERRRLHAILDDYQPDIIQVHGVSHPRVLRDLHRAGRTVQFVHNHGFYCSGIGLTWRFPLQPCEKSHGKLCLLRHAVHRCGCGNPIRNIMRYNAVSRDLATLRRAARVVTPSKVVAEGLQRNGIEPSRIALLPPFSPEARDLERVPSPRKTLLHVGGLSGKKGVWLTVRLLRELPGDTEIVFAGSGNERRALESHTKSRGLGDRIRIFADPSPAQWDALYRQCLFVILPSLWNEPLGWLALRAFAYGRPVIAFDQPGLNSWIRHNENGLLVPLDERRSFQQTVCALLKDPKKIESLGRTALKHSRELFTAERHLEALLQVYRSTLQL